MGRVGDLGFGFTKALPEAGRPMAAGFLPAVAVVFAAAGVVFFGGSCSFEGAGVVFFGGPTLEERGAFAALLIALVGDLAGFETDLAEDVETGVGLGAGLEAGLVVAAAFGLPFVVAGVGVTLFPLVAALSVGLPGNNFVFVSSSSVTLSGFGFGAILGLRRSGSFLGSGFEGAF